MKTMKRAALALSFAAMIGSSMPVMAEEAGVFGVVDMNRVMQTTDAAKDVFSQLEAKRKEYQSQISKEEDTLRAAEQEIVAQKDKISKGEFDKKKKAFEEKVISGQKLVQSRKRTLDMAFNRSMGKLREEAAKIVSEIAKEKKYSAVFTRDAVMIFSPSLDMTDAVVGQMNKNMKKIAVDWSVADAPAGEKK